MARSEEIDCVATIGMQRHCRVNANDFSSPDAPWPSGATIIGEVKWMAREL